MTSGDFLGTLQEVKHACEFILALGHGSETNLQNTSALQNVRLLATIMKTACRGKRGSIVRWSDLCALVDRTGPQAALSLAHSAARVRRKAIRDIDARRKPIMASLPQEQSSYSVGDEDDGKAWNIDDDTRFAHHRVSRVFRVK